MIIQSYHIKYKMFQLKRKLEMTKLTGFIVQMMKWRLSNLGERELCQSQNPVPGLFPLWGG